MGKFGGSQPNAGRPKGSRNKANAKREREILASGLTPLDFMIAKLRDEHASDEDRKWAAQNAAPYVHPKLSAITADITGTIDVRSKLLDLK